MLIEYFFYPYVIILLYRHSTFRSSLIVNCWESLFLCIKLKIKTNKQVLVNKAEKKMSNKCNEYLFTREHNECIDAYVMYTERT